jgi:hypothetical protein
LLAHLLGYLVNVPSLGDLERKAYEQARTKERDEELLAIVVFLAPTPQNHIALKVQLFTNLLLDFKLCISYSYMLQKKKFSKLANMVFIEAPTMKGENADAPPKLLYKLNYESKCENNERIRSWGTLPGSHHFGGRGACWSSEMGTKKSDK